MRRKTFDMILTAGGAVLVVVLIAAGSLALWGASYASSNVHNQLAMQQIFVPQKGSPQLASAQIGPYLDKYAGQQVLTGAQAQAYADHFIAVHLAEMPYHGVYAKVSAASKANPNNAALKTEVQTVFQGTTLRGLLLEAYAFSTIGQVAMWAAVISFVLAGVVFILTLLGAWHLSRVPAEEEVFSRFMRKGEADSKATEPVMVDA